MKTKVIVGIVMVLVLFGSLNIMPAFAQLPSGAVSHWTFDEGSGTTASDYENGNHGTLIDENSTNADRDTPPVWVLGKVGGALYFDGFDDVVNCGDDFGAISAAQALTVEAWIKTTRISGRNIVTQAYYGNGPWSFYTSGPDDGKYVGIFFRDAPPSPGSSFTGSRYVINDGEWHYVAGTWDGSTDIIRLYVDGKLDSEWTNSFEMRSTHFPLTIGSNSPHPSPPPPPAVTRYWFEGAIDEVAVYSRALTFEEIQQRYIENGGNVVLATLGRYWIYDEANIFADTVSGVQIGYLRSRYDITKEGEVDITDATIELETPITPENFQTDNIQPPCTPDFDEVINYTYTWDFGDLLGGQGAMVSLPTYYAVPFNLGFEGQRIWDPWIASQWVTQTLTIEFTALTIDFHNVHVSVQIPNTTKASPAIDPDSILASPMEDERGQNWTMWSETDMYTGDIVVDWGGDPELGVTYTFSVDVTIENNFFPEPVFYKPAAGFGANFDGNWFPPETPPKIADDINRNGVAESSVTYNGTGAFTWKEYAQSEHAISLPWCSFGFREIYTNAAGSTFVKLENGFLRGPAILRINKEPNTVQLQIGEARLWWEIINHHSRGPAIILDCIPTTPGQGGTDPGPTPITVTITRFEEDARVAAFGRGIKFTGKITEIEWPPP